MRRQQKIKTGRLSKWATKFVRRAVNIPQWLEKGPYPTTNKKAEQQDTGQKDHKEFSPFGISSDGTE
jgi:hypothetical protein